MRYLPLFMLVTFCCSVKQPDNSAPSFTYDEKFRPQFHFSPPTQWTNDPNGLVFYKDEYHLFYQYNPYRDTWGHMSWGHAVSKDLIHWETLPVAIPEYANEGTGDSTMIFSGTVVVDQNNSSGFCKGKDCLVAIYTSHVHANGQGKKQHESLAFSNDKGRTWERFSKNPILDVGRKDFRDPKIFWSEAKKEWIMTLVIPELHQAQFYSSRNLTEWKLLGDFGPAGDTLKIWECPDLFEASVDGHEKRWVFTLSGSHPAGPGFVGMQYFVGNFDGKRFSTIHPSARYVNYGKDFYAGIVFNGLSPETPPIMIGWAQNWTYAPVTPTSPWRGAMSIPHELSLHVNGTDTVLQQKPIPAMASLRDHQFENDEKIKGQALELIVDIDPGKSKEMGIKILKTGAEETVIGYRAETHELFIDRTHSGKINFHPAFASIDVVPLDANDHLQLHIFIDHSIVEVFANDGMQVLTECVYPTQDAAEVETYTKDGDAAFSIQAWSMKSIWK